MATEPKGTSADTPPPGWVELAEARWADAKRIFLAALEAEETPEALEGLSWAAWWLDDAEMVFDARERAFHLYRKRGEPASAARMATWLGSDHLDFRGTVAVASGWLRRASRLLDPLEPGPDHGWLAFHEGYIASLQGDSARSTELAARATELGRRFEVPDLEMLGLALQGVVLVARARVEEGMGCLDEAAATALQGEATIPISRAWTCCFVVSACEAVRDYPRAFEWCDTIAEFSRRYGSRYMTGFCRAHYAAVHMWRGRWSEAEADFEAAVEAYSRSRPAFVAGALTGLAELRRRQGRWEEADRLLDEAGARAPLLCRARLALDRGDSRRAAEQAERLLRRMPQERRLARAPALELLIRARAARGELSEAAATLAELRELTRLAATLPLRAVADGVAGTVAAAEGDHERARTLLEDAVDRFELSGAPFETAQARMELATTLLALGRNDAAAREAKVCLDSLTELGGEAAARRARRLLEGPAREGSDGGALRGITRREREVLRWVAEGLTNREIADRLVVSEHTVHRHVSNILRKLNLPSRTAAAAQAVRSGLFERPQR